MISLASSFQHRQPQPVSITLAPTNRRRTFASTKFRWIFRRAFPAKQCTSSANGHHPRVSLVKLYAVMCSVTRIRRWLRHLPQLRRLLRNSGELFRHLRSPLAEGEHTIAFVSSFPFRFAIPMRVWRSFPSNPSFFFFSLCFCSGQPPWKDLPELSARPCAWPTLDLCSAHPRASTASRPSRLYVAWRPRRVARQEPEPHVAAVVFLPPVEIRSPPRVPTVGEHTSEIPSTSSFRSEPRPSPRPPPPPTTGTARSTCTLLSLKN
jgi:hypothetical protein